MTELIPNAEKTTTILGSYEHDLKFMLRELDVRFEIGEVDQILQRLRRGNKGSFNFLNVDTPAYEAIKRRYGSFFDTVNAKWIDDAVARGDDILVVSHKNLMRDEFDNLTGFGKEVTRLIDVHNYHWNSDFTRLLAPTP